MHLMKKSYVAKIERNQLKTCGDKPHRLDPGLTIVNRGELTLTVEKVTNKQAKSQQQKTGEKGAIFPKRATSQTGDFSTLLGA